jgi:hypothetical protein
MIFEFAFVPRNKSFNRLQIRHSSSSNSSEFGEVCMINLMKGDKCDKKIEIFTKRPRLGQISRHNTKLTPGVSHPRVHQKARRPQKRLWACYLARPSLRGPGEDYWRNGPAREGNGPRPKQLVKLERYP